MSKKDWVPFGSVIPVSDNFKRNDDWRFERPAWDTQKCVRCGACCLACPDGAIFQNTEGCYEADLQYCKGCGLCVRQCVTGCISLEKAVERAPWLAK
ncbi:MAG: pyruvate synthase subunit PorD [Deltaproteobacteria bacterium]|nr:pyruvate synthase subunit PorD [Deltaproteobacteria bacterium]